MTITLLITYTDEQEPIGPNNMVSSLFGGFIEIDPSGRLVMLHRGEPPVLENIIQIPTPIPLFPIPEWALAPKPPEYEELSAAADNLIELYSLPFFFEDIE